MVEHRDQKYLLQSQYRDATNFSARVELHRRFSQNKYGWHRWVFDQLQMHHDAHILELGCGPGLLWLSNQRRIPAGWRVTLSDFSPGMLNEARQRLGRERFDYEIIDAQAIPRADASIDAVIANHMLYHVPHLERALVEIQRVLRPGGRLYATTVGHDHMREMDDLIRRALPDISWRNLGERLPFLLENGQALLAPFFSPVALFTYEDALEVTEAEPLIAYARSQSTGSQLGVEQVERFRELIQRELAAYGTIHITNASGMFAATKTL